MNKKEFEERYKDVMPNSELRQIKIGDSKAKHHHDTSHDVSFLDENGMPYRFGHFHHSHYAGLTEDLINAYRDGKLIWKEEIPEIKYKTIQSCIDIIKQSCDASLQIVNLCNRLNKFSNEKREL